MNWKCNFFGHDIDTTNPYKRYCKRCLYTEVLMMSKYQKMDEPLYDWRYVYLDDVIDFVKK